MAASTTHRVHTDHASKAAARRFLPPTPRSCSLAPSVTTPLYSTTVSQTLRGGVVSELPRMPIPRTSVNKGKKRRKARSGVRWPLGYDLEVPSLVLIQRVACLVLNTGGDGSRVGLAALQRISRGKGGPLSVFVVIDPARR